MFTSKFSKNIQVLKIGCLLHEKYNKQKWVKLPKTDRKENVFVLWRSEREVPLCSAELFYTKITENKILLVILRCG